MTVASIPRHAHVVAAVLAVMLLVALCAGCSQPEPERHVIATDSADEQTAIDARSAIVVDAGARFAVLAEMRTLLAAVQGIVGGLAEGDTAAVRVAALSAGFKAASESDPQAAAQFGPDFVALGMRTHLNFDSIASDVANGRSREAVLRRLATVMGNCVACHTQWRLSVRL
jgi:cytochrome c556